MQRAGRIDTELELGVGDDDAPPGRIIRRFGVQLDGRVAGLPGQLRAGLAGAGQLCP